MGSIIEEIMPSFECREVENVLVVKSNDTEQNDEDVKVGNVIQEDELDLDGIMECLYDEELKLNQLEERRKKLHEDMENLRKEIQKERSLFRKSIDEECNRRLKEHQASSTSLFSTSSTSISDEIISTKFKIDPLNINREELNETIQGIKDTIEESKLKDILEPVSVDDEEIERLKNNLTMYKKALEKNEKNDRKQKRKLVMKMVRKHLIDVDLKCSEQIDRLANIQTTIEEFHTSSSQDVGDLRDSE